MRKLTVGKMDLFVFLRRLVYPTLEEHLDEAFPEFSFRKASYGWWVARNSPSNFRDFGHGKGKLVARGWGFRSLLPRKPTVFWLSYVNKQKFPGKPELQSAIRTLAGKVRISYDWEIGDEQLSDARERICRHLLPEALLTHFQGELWSAEGHAARTYLQERMGISQNNLLPLELGYYTSALRVRTALHESGFDGTLDDERAGGTGILQPQWEERIVGPWRDVYGRRVLNFWGYRFPMPMENEPVFEYLRPLDLQDPLGSRNTPLGLHMAARLKEKNLLLVESPLSAILAYTKGLRNPCPVATGGGLSSEQVQVLEKYLQHGGSLTLLLDYRLGSREDVHAGTYDALDLLRNVSFPVYVVDPVGLKMDVNELWREVIDPSMFIQERGMDGFVELIRTRVPADRFSPGPAPQDEGGIF